MDIKANLEKIIEEHESYYWPQINNYSSTEIKLGENHSGQLIFKYDKTTNKCIIERHLFPNGEVLRLSDLSYSQLMPEYHLIYSLIVMIENKLIDNEYLNRQNILASKLMSRTERFVNENFVS